MTTPEFEHLIVPDAKGEASELFAGVIKGSDKNYPDESVFAEIYAKYPDSYTARREGLLFYTGKPRVDGTGTKPHNPSRRHQQDGDPTVFRSVPFDAFSMIKGDIERDGGILLGAADVIDINIAQMDVMEQLAIGASQAAQEGHFALVGGEIAELGPTMSGPGDIRVNINAMGVPLFEHGKELDKKIQPDLLVVGFEEKTFRSNGNTMNNRVLDAAYLHEHGFSTKEALFYDFLQQKGITATDGFIQELSRFAGHDMLEQMFLPWHVLYPQIVKELSRPSNLYGKIMYDAQGGMGNPVEVHMAGAVHVTGGGIPLKGSRAMKPSGIGLYIDSVFPDPVGIQQVKSLYKNLPDEMQNRIGLTDERSMREWNSGIGFMVIVQTLADADRLIEIASGQNVTAAVVGKTIDEKAIKFRGHTWRYN